MFVFSMFKGCVANANAEFLGNIFFLNQGNNKVMKASY